MFLIIDVRKGKCEMFDMKPYELYNFILCLVVYIALVAVFSVMIAYILRLTLKLIRNGVEDDRIREEYEEKAKRKKKHRVWNCIDRVVTVVICLVLFVAFLFSAYIQVFADNVNTDIPLYRVVLSDSMSKKYEKNEYLFENGLDDQIDRFDLILTHKLPDEFDLRLYDIVVYEVDETLVVHRIVQIEEPNAQHPNERHFRMQGDNVHVADKFPVRYEQMKAIYRGERIPFVGSFVAFLQSPAGYICILLVLLGVIAIPLIDKKIEKEEKLRLSILAEEESADNLTQ